MVVGHVRRALLFDQRAAPREQLQDAGDDLVQHGLQRLIGRRSHLDEDRVAFGAPVHAVQHQAVQVDVQVGSRPEALDSA